MNMSQLEEVLQQQALNGISRYDELKLIVEQLVYDAMALGETSERLVSRLQQELHARATAKLEWKRDPRNWLAAQSDQGTFILRHLAGDQHHLSFWWKDYGGADLGTGTQAQLLAKAQTLMREGGPFGGPEPDDPPSTAWYEWRNIKGSLRRAGIAGELVINPAHKLRRAADDHHLLAVYRDGTFACISRGSDRNLMPFGDKLAQDRHLRERFPPVTAKIGDLAVPWRYLDHPLFRGIISTPAADLVLLSLRQGTYAILCCQSAGEHLPLALRWIDEIQDFNVGPILAEILGHREFEVWLKLADLVPPRRKEPSPSLSAPVQAPTSAPERPSSSPIHLPGTPPPRSLPEPSPTTSVPAPVHHTSSSSRGAPSAAPPASSRPPSSGEPSPPPIDGDAVVLQHLKSFLQEIPTGQGGSATARAVIPGVVDDYLHGAPSIEGTWKELFEHFVGKGFLDDMPSDKTARAALGILKDSPIFRRIDTQRWRICLEECRAPKSDVFQALLREHLERSR